MHPNRYGLDMLGQDLGKSACSRIVGYCIGSAFIMLLWCHGTGEIHDASNISRVVCSEASTISRAPAYTTSG